MEKQRNVRQSFQFAFYCNLEKYAVWNISFLQRNSDVIKHVAPNIEIFKISHLKSVKFKHTPHGENINDLFIS